MRLPRCAPRAARLSALALVLASSPVSAQPPAPRPAAPPAPVASAAPAQTEEFRVSLFVAQQLDRFNPGIAASENSVATGGMVAGCDVDFRVSEVWMPKRVRTRPRLEFSGRILAGERVLAQSVATAVDTLTGEAPDSLVVFPDAKSVELVGALRLAYPVHVLAGKPQTAVYLKAETGAVFAEHMTGDLLATTRIGLGFERLAGTFSGSLLEVLNGSNEAFGASHSSGRYTVHVLVRGAIAAAEGSRRVRSHLGAFVDLEVDTDNAGGPDGVRAMMGLTLDGDGLFEAVRGLVGM
jgi:hypothetical protein